MKIAIIGAGLGGLTFGAFAAKEGHQVHIFDKNAAPGGVVALLEHEGYRFEQGPLLMGDMLPGESLYELLKELGIELQTERADRDIVMPDYDMIKPKAYGGKYWRRERLKSLFPEDAEGIDEYYKVYDHVMHLRWLGRQHQTIGIKIRTALAMLKLKKYADMNADEFTRYFFKSEKIRTLFTGIFADFCADPKEVQGLGVIFMNFESAFDLRIPIEEGQHYYGGYVYFTGGCQKLPEALADYIRNHGGTITYGAIVDKVLIENNTATGIRLSDGSEFAADMVVGCGAGKDFFESCVGLEHISEDYRRILESYLPMEAVFMVHLGVDYDPMLYLRSPLTYCYGMYDLSAATQKLRNHIYHGGHDGYLIYVPSHHAPDFAPRGKHCVTLYTVCPDTLAEGSWESVKEHYADQLVALAEKHLPDLKKHTVTRKIMTAADYRNYTHMKKSSFGGVVPIWGQKNPPHETSVNGLYFVGQQSENGGGVGAVMTGARAAWEKARILPSKQQNSLK
ncbi:MAG: NAD(P)/FAD-dependent oxidoreductase [Oscillospiraceae bacterium]|nr:NAD(P)/FAD-dependent oxidoreductase [Oscillospiraceae bacterium]